MSFEVEVGIEKTGVLRPLVGVEGCKEVGDLSGSLGPLDDGAELSGCPFEVGH